MNSSVYSGFSSAKLLARPLVEPLGLDEQPLPRRLCEDFSRILILELRLDDSAERPQHRRRDIPHHLFEQTRRVRVLLARRAHFPVLIVTASPALITAWMRQMPMALPYSSSPRVTSARALSIKCVATCQ